LNHCSRVVEARRVPTLEGGKKGTIGKARGGPELGDFAGKTAEGLQCQKKSKSSLGG